MRPTSLLAAAALLCLSACGERVNYTYTKVLKDPTQAVLINDKQTLESTSGVSKAIISGPDHNGMLTLQLLMDESNTSEGMHQALGLGYTPAPGH